MKNPGAPSPAKTPNVCLGLKFMNRKAYANGLSRLQAGAPERRHSCRLKLPVRKQLNIWARLFASRSLRSCTVTINRQELTNGLSRLQAGAPERRHSCRLKLPVRKQLNIWARLFASRSLRSCTVAINRQELTNGLSRLQAGAPERRHSCRLKLPMKRQLTTGARLIASPSPRLHQGEARPSPAGRRKIDDRLLVHPERIQVQARGRGSSLSQRERAGVRESGSHRRLARLQSPVEHHCT